MSASMMTPINDNVAITQLLNVMAYAEDTLDWQLFQTCWTTTDTLQIDLSSHLSQFSSDLKISAADLAKTAHLQLSGFDGTQHLLSNYVINIDNSGVNASARAYVTAYHAFHRPAVEGPGFVLVRGTWKVSCVKGSDGKWIGVGIKVDRMVAAEGEEGLYALARQKAESGKGRKALTLWKK